MVNRLVEIMAPSAKADHIDQILADTKSLATWCQRTDDAVQYKVVLSAKDVEQLLDPLQAYTSVHDDVRVVVLQAQAFLPAVETAEAPPPAEPEEKTIGSTRISRQELDNDLRQAADAGPIFVTTVVLSTIVAAIGLLRDSPEILVGAMVIAPLMGPNMALVLATTLGDGTLARRALRANAVGFATALASALVVGLFVRWFVGLDPSIPALASRTQITPGDILLALAAGSAGALAYTTGVSTALVGVMVAVALLPPFVAMAMLFATGHLSDALGALLLVAVNLICVNLSGIATFVVQGVRPANWWDATRAKHATRRALCVWIALFVAATLIVVAR